MNRYVSMLRGINVSGYNKISMADLKNLYESLDFRNIVTYGLSGNVIFNSPLKDVLKLSYQIQTQLKKSLELFVPVLLRNTDDLKRIISENPFIKRKEDPTKLHVTFLNTYPTPSDLNKL